MKNHPVRTPEDYATLAIDAMTLKELTDGLDVKVAAEVLNTSTRAIYTVRNTNVVGVDRMLALRAAFKEREEMCRTRLVTRAMLRLARHALKPAIAAAE
jgi:hypothetical protein